MCGVDDIFIIRPPTWLVGYCYATEAAAVSCHFSPTVFREVRMVGEAVMLLTKYH
ncbi:hypothetical protein Pogu_0238 [Pyrobaculum oguniense TE7]|uniref:Uncharacterized protein n=1 Tax=Pyrobaculum oguniense (strain DSM 13380 / JCM 10595 / TE7) TaxID=698757 RepID=H6Q6N5_PYROT|nr:hypothetical protein Pogu_0238 [Pyrobaculum oguniense TE7]